METEEREDESQKLTTNIEMEAVDETSGHTCGVCGRSFPLLRSLSQHMRQHKGEKPYKCPYCEHRTAQKGSLKAHIQSHKKPLGLFSPSDKGRGGDQEQKDNSETPDPPEIVSTSDKAHNVNRKVKKGTKKKVTGKDAIEVSGADDGSCTNEPPATINGVPQDSASLTNEECLFELCGGCGSLHKGT
ncbi:hypothetical protein VZT92_021271 [Zoarces viviparus]|uniref:C2H2-type domain-containing protein n=2 Tax=Zoarces viviparus TaxID=48416 RepID=A0AAW1EH88_ZOAVI